MSVEVATTQSLPAINQALEPASVRDGSPAVQKAYETALGFEEMLVQQLSQQLTETSGLSGGEAASGDSSSGSEGSQGAEAATESLSSLLPQALTESVMSAGGLGLAQQLMVELDPSAATASVGAGKGTSG